MSRRETLTIKAGTAEVSVSNPQKVLFPETGSTKEELVRYFLAVADLMLPHVSARPLTLVRFPEGAGGDEFYQKEAQDYFPDFIQRVPVEISDEMRTYITAENPATLAYLANLVSIPHIWISLMPDVHVADIVVWDLDPGGSVGFDEIKTGARLLRHLLSELDIPSHIKLTGSRGIHLSAALQRPMPQPEVFEFSKNVAEMLAKKLPAAFTTEFSRDKRGNRIYIDYLRNRYAQSFVAPYAVRSTPHASIAMPIEWSDLDSDMGPQDIRLENVYAFLKERTERLASWHVESFDFPSSVERLAALS